MSQLTKEQIDKVVRDALVTAQLKASLGLIDHPSNDLPDDWAEWLQLMFPQHVRAEFASHHEDFWAWVWGIKKGLYCPPFIAIWPRGGAKSSSAELACVALGARKARKYGLYLSDSQDQADKHVETIASMLESSNVDKYYPDLASRRVGKYGQSKGWRRNRLRTRSGFTIDALGLDKAARGIKVEAQRPDFLVIDDVDNELDSMGTIERKITILTKKILPAGSTDLIVLGAQNLVHRRSIFSKLAKKSGSGAAEFLTDRIVSGPFPALRNFKHEMRGGKAVITAGVPIWKGQDLVTCQRFINREGLTAFLSECQQEVDQVLTGAVFPEFDERYHVITWGEFQKFYGSLATDKQGRPCIPIHWKLGRALDKGTTVDHPSGCVWVARPGMGDDFNDTVFVYRELTMPEWPTPTTMEVTPQRVGEAIYAVEAPHQESSRFVISLLSHEATDWLNTFRLDMPPGKKLLFHKWRPDRMDGIAQIQNRMQIIETDHCHPFRQDLMGRPRLILIVDDKEGSTYLDQDGELQVQEATTAAGLVRLRSEIPAYHYPKDTTGQEKEQPIKFFDDLIDPLKAMAAVMFPSRQHLTEDQKIEQQLPMDLRRDNVVSITDPKLRAGKDWARQTAYAEIKHRKDSNKVVDWRRSIREKYGRRAI